jgi:hypothetical protein
MSKEMHILSYLKNNGYTDMTAGEESWWRGWYQCYQSKTLFYGWSLLPEDDYKVRMELVMDYMVSYTKKQSEVDNAGPHWVSDEDIYGMANTRTSYE